MTFADFWRELPAHIKYATHSGAAEAAWQHQQARIAELEAQLAEAQKAMDRLCAMFDLYENGIPVTENGEDGVSLGNAVKLDEETFQWIVELLNKHRPVKTNL